MNSKAILDSSVLIRLARLNYLNFLLKTFDEIYVTREVREEVLRDDKPEVEAIKDFLKNVKIISNDLNVKDIQRVLKLDNGEITCLYFANCKDITFLSDDYDAVIFARNFLKLRAYGTLRLIVYFYKNNLISKEEAKSKIENIRELTGLWVSDEIIAKALSMIELI